MTLTPVCFFPNELPQLSFHSGTMSKRAHPSDRDADYEDPFATAQRNRNPAAATAAAAAASSSSETPSAKRVKFDDLVASGFGAEAFGGKVASKSSVDGLLLGGDEKSNGSHAADASLYDDGDSNDGPYTAAAPPMSAEEEMAAILKLVDDAPEVAELDANAVRIILQKFNKAATKNMEQRALFESQPEKVSQTTAATGKF